MSARPTFCVDPTGLEKLILFDQDPWLAADKIINMNARAWPDTPGVLYVFSHGSSKYIVDDREGMYLDRVRLYPKDAAALIRASGLWREGMPVVIVACQTAKGANSFAEQLSKQLRTQVLGYTRLIAIDGYKGVVSPSSSRTFKP